jgi:hypothetical protein
MQRDYLSATVRHQNYSVVNPAGIGCGNVPLNRLLRTLLNSTKVRAYSIGVDERPTGKSKLRAMAAIGLPIGWRRLLCIASMSNGLQNAKPHNFVQTVQIGGQFR